MMILSLARWPAIFDSRRRAALIYAGLLLFLPCELIYIACVQLHNKGDPVTLQNAWEKLVGGWFTEFAWMTGTYLAMVAIGNWRRAKARELAWQRAQTDNLNLHLALEQQRMLSLRAQLEPHFIFNALNAISALVRSGDKTVALTGISRLSDLLRYALSASLRDTVTSPKNCNSCATIWRCSGCVTVSACGSTSRATTTSSSARTARPCCCSH
jgi:hypothetical protein